MKYVKQNKSLRTLTWVFLSLGIAMCAKKEASTVTLTGRASLGPIRDAVVTVHKLEADGTIGEKIGTGSTDTDGKFTIEVATQTNPVAVEIEGGKYEEESGGAEVELGENKLHLYMESCEQNKQVGVDALTEIAAKRAEALIKSGKNGSHSNAIQAANKATAVAAGLDDITEMPDHPDKPEFPGTMKAKKALVLAGLSKLAVEKGLNSLHEASALAEDFADGAFDGKDSDGNSVSKEGHSFGEDEWSKLADKEEEFIRSEDNKGSFSSDDICQVVSQPSKLAQFNILSASDNMLKWEASLGATKYEVKICNDSACESVVYEGKVSALEFSLASCGLVSGNTYYASIEAKDEAGSEKHAVNDKYQFRVAQ